MKKTIAAFLLLLVAPLLYAQEVTLVNKVDGLQTQSAQKNVDTMSHPSGIKQISIAIRDGNTDEYSLAYPSSPLETATININKGAHYQINIEGTNNQWYHTKEVAFQPDNTQGKTETITINGQGLPYTIEQRGKVLSTFYNEQDWPAYQVNCTNHAGGGLNGVVCSLRGQTDKQTMRVTALQPSTQFEPYKSQGVVFIDTAFTHQQPPSEGYTVNLAPYNSQEQLKITDNQGQTRGWGVLNLSAGKTLPNDNTLMKGTLTPTA